MISEHMIADATSIGNLNCICSSTQSAIPGLTIYSGCQPAGLVPALFEPRFYLLLQGAKRMVIARQDIVIRPGDYAMSSLGLPFQTEVIEASLEKPYLGVAFTLDQAMVAEILLACPNFHDVDGSAFSSGRANRDVVDPVARLLTLSRSPSDIEVMAPLLSRELVYRLAKGPMRSTLHMAAKGHRRFDQVRAAAEWIRNHCYEPMRVSDLASRVGMSVTSLHRNFRSITGKSPLAYQRHFRLLAARERVVAQGDTITTIAFDSGYASASQFSREYKQMFGVTPRHDSTRHDRSRRAEWYSRETEDS